MLQYTRLRIKISPSAVCPDRTINNSPTDLKGIEAGSTVTVFCTDNSFELEGSSTVSCDNDGSWPNDLPTCEKKGMPIERTIALEKDKQ